MRDNSLTVLSQDFSRNLTLLTDENRYKKKAALSGIANELKCFLNTAKEEDCDVVRSTLKEIAPLLTDQSEGIRNNCLEIFNSVLDSSFDTDECMSYFVPIFGKSLELLKQLDSSEELRLDSILLVEKALILSKNPSIFIQDLIAIICSALSDLYPDIKKKASQACTLLSEKAAHNFYMCSSVLVKPLCANLTHQHSKVRLETVKSLATIMKNSKGDLVEQVLAPLTQRLFDPAPNVREATIELAGDWLINLPDRYSYHLRLVPLLLGGLLDDYNSNRELASDLWNEVGIKYEQENRDELKDRIDFDCVDQETYPKGYKRPNFGCRELINRTAYKLIPCLVNDLSDWQSGTRSEASGLLPILVLHLEQHVLKHSQVFLEGVSKAMMDFVRQLQLNPNACEYLLKHGLLFNEEDLKCSSISESLTLSLDMKDSLKVASKLLEAVFLFSHFCNLDTSWAIMQPLLKQCNEFSSPYSLSAHLLVLVRIIDGCHPENRAILLEIARFVASDDMLGSQAIATKLALALCAQSFLIHLKEEEIDLKSSLFQLQAAICSVWIESSLRESDLARNCISFASEKILSRILSGDNALTAQLQLLLDRVEASLHGSRSWYPKSTELFLLEYALKTMALSLLVQVLPRAMHLLIVGCRLEKHASANDSCLPTPAVHEQDPMIMASEAELRLRGLIILTTICADHSVREALSQSVQLRETLMRAVLPSCVWRAGRVAESMRAAASTALLALLGAFIERNLCLHAMSSPLKSHLDVVQLADAKVAEIAQLTLPKVPVLEGVLERQDKESFLVLGYDCLKLLLTRLAGLLTDDVEETRVMALKSFGQLCLGLGDVDPIVLQASAVWRLNPTQTDQSPKDGVFPDSVGDMFFKFYPNLVKRLDDVKDSVRLLSADCFVHWTNLVSRIVVKPGGLDLNVTYTAVIQDVLDGAGLYLDDQDLTMRLAIAKLLLVVAREISLKMVLQFLQKSLGKCRCKDLINALISYLDS
ncbi:HEAT repeat-containing protein 2 [Cichlidogyrus casuarinus]|uniref:HEAT repeat-containing protein 2 n=1 Tax=Cichlidogyrus casuarinus TaxID=1844966 RepID=A0ABD2QM74_9PLAT